MALIRVTSPHAHGPMSTARIMQHVLLATIPGVVALTQSLAKEVARDGIRVNAVRPGLIHTAIQARGGEVDRVDRLAGSVPMGRGGRPEEVARTILWLASDDASYVTGALVDCAGGR